MSACACSPRRATTARPSRARQAFADELSRRGLAGEVVTLADGGATGVGRWLRPSVAMQAKARPHCRQRRSFCV
ncbi:MAG: hypothetical protein ACLS3M_06110 [Collinsella sp.]